MSEENEAGSAGRARRSIVVRVFNSLKTRGPLATLDYACEVLQDPMGRVPGGKSLLKGIKGILRSIEQQLDKGFDRTYGTDTSGSIQLDSLAIRSKSVSEGNRYEGMPPQVFKRTMKHLGLDFGQFEFLDYGSGKGRILLLASEYGFRRAVGVEFSEDLCRIADRNIEIYERRVGRKAHIESMHADATEFPIPETPLVVFLYSPFRGEVMQKVVDNIVTSFRTKPRAIVLIFRGQNPESIEMLKNTGFPCREIDVPDWSRAIQYRTLILTTQPETVGVLQKSKAAGS